MNKKIIVISIFVIIGIAFGGVLLGFSFSQGTKLSVKYDFKKLEKQKLNAKNRVIKESLSYNKKLVFSDDKELENMIKTALYEETGKVYTEYLNNNHYEDVMETYIEIIKKTNSFKGKKYNILDQCINKTCLVYFTEAYEYCDN